MSKRLSAARLAEIKAREQAATRGPWAFAYRGEYGVLEFPSGDSDSLDHAANNPPPPGSCFERDSRFLNHVRQDIPDLLAEIERLQGLIKQAEWAVLIDSLAFCPWCNGTDPGPHEPTCPAFGSEA
jgi:hypothetical protein